MPYAKGFRTLGAYKRATAWNTPVLLGAGNGFEYLSESLAPDAQFIPDEQVSGSATRLFGDKGNEFHSGDVMADMRYQGLDTIIALAMGTAGAPTQVGVDDAYKHVFKVANDKEGLFATFAFDKKVAVWEYPTAKVGGFTLQASNGQRVKLTAPLIPGSLNLNVGSGTNTLATMGSVTLPTMRDFLLFSQTQIRINAAADGALDDDDLVYASEFSLTLNNNYPTDDVTTRLGNRVDEPVQDGFSDFTGVLNFSKYNNEAQGNSALFDALMAKTRMKATVTFTGPIADGATPYSLKLWLNDLQFSSGEANVGGPQRVPLNLNFQCARRTAIPAGWTSGYLDPVVIDLVNRNSANALA
jgi:hypothetical protein